MDMAYTRIRAWVRGELDDSERRFVGQWVIRSCDPGLPDLLSALAHEHLEELRDAEAARAHPALAGVIRLWHRLLEMGRATFVPLAPHTAPAMLGGRREPAGFGFVERGGEVEIRFQLESAAIAAVLATTDEGAEHILVEPAHHGQGSWLVPTRWRREEKDGRVRMWLCTAPPGTVPPAELRNLTSAAANPAVRIIAAQWDESA
jgi:hypothetical protein